MVGLAAEAVAKLRLGVSGIPNATLALVSGLLRVSVGDGYGSVVGSDAEVSRTVPLGCRGISLGPVAPGAITVADVPLRLAPVARLVGRVASCLTPVPAGAGVVRGRAALALALVALLATSSEASVLDTSAPSSSVVGRRRVIEPSPLAATPARRNALVAAHVPGRRGRTLRTFVGAVGSPGRANGKVRSSVSPSASTVRHSYD